jgi:hypothetical protein
VSSASFDAGFRGPSTGPFACLETGAAGSSYAAVVRLGVDLAGPLAVEVWLT